MRKIVILILCIFLNLSCIRNPYENVPLAQKGILDLSGYKFLNNEMIPIKGEWEFYWNTLYSKNQDLPARDMQESSHYIRLPGVWNGKDIDGNKISGYGYGTMRLQILLPDAEKEFALSFPKNFYSVHTVWINGERIQWNGIPGESPETTNFHEHDLMDYYTISTKTLDIVVEVSNFRGNTRWGGIRYPFYIGKGNTIRSSSLKTTFLSFFIFSFILAIGIYHLSFFWNYRKDKLPVYFAFFCMAVSLYSLLTSTAWIVLFPKSSPNGIFRMEFLLELSMTPICYLFLSYLFPKDFSRRIRNILLVLSALMSLGGLFLSIEEASFLYGYSLYFPLIFGTYILINVVLIYFKKRKHSGLILLSVIVLFVFMLNDVMNGLVNVVFFFPYSFPLGLLLFISLHSHIISERQAEAFKNAEELVTLQNKFNMQSKSQAEERARIARDIHDSIGSEITAMMTYVESKDVSPTESLQKMKKHLAGVLINIRDIVYLLGQDKKESDLLEGEIHSYLDRLKATQKFQIDTKIEPVSTYLGMERSLNMQRIFLEVMTNTIRHSKAKSISIQIYKKSMKVRMLIVNDGVPFQWSPSQSVPGSFGLDGITLRCKKIKGIVRFFHSKGKNYFLLNVRI